MDKTSHPLLRASAIAAGYENKLVLRGVNVEVGTGEIVAVIGHNGAGKSTLLKALYGMIPLREGDVTLDHRKMDRPSPRKMLLLGMGYVPQGNRVFTHLTVRENLELGAVTLKDKKGLKEQIDRVIGLFPILGARIKQRAEKLSGGERQMLALSNALILRPRVLLLDEPSLGLAPMMVATAMQQIKEISCAWGTAVLVVEQKVREILKVSHRVYVLRNGQVSFAGMASELSCDDKLRQVYL